MAFGQSFVVAGAAAMGCAPGQGALHDPAPEQDLEGLRIALRTISGRIFRLAAQAVSLPA